MAVCRGCQWEAALTGAMKPLASRAVLWRVVGQHACHVQGRVLGSTGAAVCREVCVGEFTGRWQGRRVTGGFLEHDSHSPLGLVLGSECSSAAGRVKSPSADVQETQSHAGP